MDQMAGGSFIVSFYGLDGLREHYMPGNRRRGTSVREKRPFDSGEEAQAFCDERGLPNHVYQCSICGKWHTAKPARR